MMRKLYAGRQACLLRNGAGDEGWGDMGTGRWGDIDTKERFVTPSPRHPVSPSATRDVDEFRFDWGVVLLGPGAG